MTPTPQTFMHVFGPGIGVIGRINEIGEFFVCWYGCDLQHVDQLDYIMWLINCYATAEIAGIKCNAVTEHYLLPSWTQKKSPTQSVNITPKTPTK